MRIARRMARAGLLALALGAGAAGSAAAQGWGVRGPDAAFLAMGVSRISTGDLDERLEARGYPTFGRTALAPSIGGYWVLSRGVLLGGEWSGLIVGEEAHEGREVGLGGGYATLAAGYVAEISPRMRVYPRLGLGLGGMGVWIERGGETVGFDEVLADPERHEEPERSLVLSRVSAVVDLGAGAELRVGGPGRGPLIGVRLGYLAAPFSSEWWLYESRVSDGPAASIAGPYLRVVVGAWRRP